MAEIIPVQNLIYSKDTFTKVINTQFTELNTNPVTVDDTSVERFFELYDELFLVIPKEGDINSHKAILIREADYLGVRIADDDEIQALLQEITDLRQQLLQTEVNDAQALSQASIIL
jgi:hypothetical protein